RPQAMRSPGGAGMADVVLEVERSTGIARRAHSGSSTGGRVSTDSLTRALDGDQYEMNFSFPHSWRPLAVLLAFQAALVALALAGLARADEPVGPTLRILLSVPRHTSDHAEEDGTRRARLEGIADAIDTATPHAHERALLLAVGWHESRWSSAVGAGDHLGDEGRARGYWQQWGLTEDATLEHQADRAIRL